MHILNFSSNSGVKTKKKHSFHPKLRPSEYGPFASFRGTILAREGTLIAWLSATESYGADLGSYPFRDEDQTKKGLRRKILG